MDAMEVTMTRARVWQHAGREHVLSVGQIYDLPEGVAAALIATGAAHRVIAAAVAPVREMAVVGPTETGRRRRR